MVAIAGRVRYLRSQIVRRRHRAELVAKLPKGGVGAEIGVWKGDYSATLLKRTRPSRIYLIDPWEHHGELEHSMFAIGQRNMDAVHADVAQRFVADQRVMIIRASSLAAVHELEPLDWVYIDGDHNYAAVKADLEAYWPLVKQGGVVSGDDYAVTGWWGDGVKRAVDEFSAEHGCRLIVLGQQFLISKP